MFVLFSYLGLVNTSAVLLMGFDKLQAKRKRFRVPEKRLFLLAALGGSWGIFLAMQVWKHKRRKTSFKKVIYALALVHLLLLGFGLGKLAKFV